MSRRGHTDRALTVIEKQLLAMAVSGNEVPPPQRIQLPVPISTNAIWVAVVRNGKPAIITSDAYRAYKALVVQESIVQKLRIFPEHINVAVTVHIYRTRNRMDGDNYIKSLFDSLNGLAWIDDRQVKRHSCEVHDDASWHGCTVLIEAIEQEARA